MAAIRDVGRPDSLDADSLARVAGDHRRAAERLSSLTPPAAVAGSHSRLVLSLRAYADDLERASKAAASQVEFAGEMARAQADAEAWTRAFNEIQCAGYATVPASPSVLGSPPQYVWRRQTPSRPTRTASTR